MIMASGSSKAFGSTSSLSTLNGETIPKEYHRKVLKKIAQLTKVVYSLHTRNDENEECIEVLKAEHLKEKQELMQKCDTRVEELEAERNRSKALESAFMVDAEQRIQSVREEHSKELNEVHSEVERLKELIITKEKEATELQKRLNDSLNEHRKSELKMKREIENLKKQNEEALEEFQQELKSLKMSHESSLNELLKEHECELESLKDFLSNQRDSALQTELQRMEEKNKALEEKMSLNQSGLLDKVSDLSAKLKKAKDELVLSQQRERDMEGKMEEKSTKEQEYKALLEKERWAVSELEQKLKDSQVNLSLLAQQQEIQNKQLKTKAALIGELEAVKIHLEKQSRSLQDQLEDVTRKLNYLQVEKTKEREEHVASSSETSQRIQSLEQEVDKLFKEKKQLHAQYAREIEAAHAQLSEHEASLNENHDRNIQEMKDKHQMEMEAIKQERAKELEVLKNEYELKLSMKESSLSKEHEEVLNNLSEKLSEKTKVASDLNNKLSQLQSEIAGKDKDLSASRVSISKLRGELKDAQDTLVELQKQRDASKIKVSQMQASLNTLREEYDKAMEAHKEGVAATEKKARKESEDMWKSKMKSELMLLQHEMDKSYSERNKAALNKLTELKDMALREAEGRWVQERNGLSQQVKLLQKDLLELKRSSEASLQQARAEHLQEAERLKNQFSQELLHSNQLRQKMVEDHTEELEKIKVSCHEEKQRAIRELTALHTRELKELQQAHLSAEASLREELLEKWEGEKEILHQAHKQQLGDVHFQLANELDSKLGDAKLHYKKEIEILEKSAKETTDCLKKEISNHKDSLASLDSQLADCKTTFAKEKEKLTLMKIELNNKEKQLKLNEQEIQTVRKEAREQLRQREEQLNSTHRADMESAISQHKHQSQIMLSEFNKAKELLNQKLHATEKRLHEAELRYRNREPRPEDVATIKELRATVKEQEAKMKDLITEKKVFQMELINRERNYNKLFSANPQIGVLDPLKGKKKTMDTLSLSPPIGMRYPNASSHVRATNSLPAIKPLSTVDQRDHPPSQSINPSPLHDRSIPSLNGFTAIPNDFELPGLIPSPTFHSHQPQESVVAGFSSPVSTRRGIKILSNSRNELTGKSRISTNHKTGGNSVQAFTSNAHSIVA